MTAQTIILALPETLYQKLKARAEWTHRTVEDEALDALAMSVSAADELPEDLEAAIAPLGLLDDEALWQAARSTMPPAQQERLAELHDKQQREGLTSEERAEDQALLALYRETLLVRAQAAALLKQRGYYPLRGTPVTYIDPTEPAANSDWEDEAKS